MPAPSPSPYSRVHAAEVRVPPPRDGRAGISPRDILLEVGGLSTQGMSLYDAAQLLQGDLGSSVSLKVKSAATGAVTNVALTRWDPPGTACQAGRTALRAPPPQGEHLSQSSQLLHVQPS